MQNALSIFLPFLIGFINTKIANVKSDRVKFWVSIFVSIIAGVILNLDQLHTISIQNAATFFVYVGLVVGTAQAVYVKYWKDHPAYVALFGNSTTQQKSNPIENDSTSQK